MRVLFDHQIFSFQNYGGASRYYFELAKHLKEYDVSTEFNITYSNNHYANDLNKNVKSLLSGFNYPYKNISLFYFNRIANDRIIRKGEYDIFHPTYYHPYFLRLINDKPYVVTVLDLIHEKFNSKYKELNTPTVNYKKKVINNASAVIAISENTKKDILECYNIDPSIVHVTHLGNSLAGIRSRKPKGGLVEKYILYVGTRGVYKNFDFFLYAISEFIKETNITLLCVGGSDFTSKEKEQIDRLSLRPLVQWHAINSDNELSYYYENALMHVVPSLYEGFGLTVLEALSKGTPVVASNSSSLPEVGGDAVVYFDPTKEEDILDKVSEVISNNKLRKKMILNGNKQAARFSWSKTARLTAKIYKQLVK